MLCRQIWLFGHPENQNLSIIDAMGQYSRIRKNVTDGEQRTENGEQRTEKQITEAPPFAVLMKHGVEKANNMQVYI